MTPDDVRKYFKSGYAFHKKTKMSANSYGNWMKWGFVPLVSQLKLQKLTNGKLKACWDDVKEDE